MRFACVFAGVLAMTTGARAAPIAKASVDVDGDGKTEDVELDADGSLRVGGVRRVTVASASGAKKASFEAAKTSSGTWLVVETGDKAAVINTRSWQVVATTPIGGVGLDHEYSVDIDATPDGIFRYQKRHDVRRCDGKPAYLFPERLDAKGTTPPAVAITGAQPLTARVETAAAGAPIIYQARAASHQPGATDAGGLAIPRELDDGNLGTVWREDLPNGGEGQFFTFTPRMESARAQTIRIVPGPRAFARPHVLAIVTAREAWRVELPAAGAAFAVDLPQPAVGCVTVILESVHGKGQPTGIAELQVFAEGERGGGGEAMAARIVAEGKGGETAAAAVLARRGAAGVAAIEAELAKTSDAGARRRLVGVLAKINDPAAAATLAKAAAAGWVRDKDLLDVIAALGASGQVPVLKELASKGPPEIRIAAVAKISPATPAGLDALVDLAGQGPRDVRRAVIERLALAPAATLAQTAAGQANAAPAGDLWRALTRRARSHPDERAAAVAAMTAALATATDYERRYRLIDGIAAYGDAQALAALQRLLSGLPVSPQSAALRQVAVRSIASSARLEAAPIVIALARDADPGVRLAAIAALDAAVTDTSNAWHTADGPDAIDRVIITALTTDTWPEVRRRAALALGGRCMRPGPAAALTDALAKDAVIDVRTDALAALVQCKAQGIRELLAKTWNAGKAPVELRERAVSLAVMLDDKPLCGQLVGRFKAWRGEALSSGPALQLAQQAAVAIGQCKAPGAAAALIEALDDPAFPEIVSAAALGLGALGTACPANAKAKLVNLSRSDSQAASAARHAANQCGR